MLPSPRARLTDCIWLPRILAKPRLIAQGKLPPEFAARFGAVDGCDGQFLQYFGLTKEEVAEASKWDDEGVVKWFTSLMSATPSRIREWNHIAVNMGRPGFPLEERLPLGLSTKYANVASRKPTTIYEMLEMDEGLL